MSQTTPPPPSAIRKVPVGATVAEAYAAVFGRFELLLKAAAVPLALSIAIEMLAWSANAVALRFLFWLLGFAPYTLFGVAWHRLTLLGPGAAAPPIVPSWTRRHWRFLQYTFAVMLLGYVVSIPFGVVVGTIASAGQGTTLSSGQAALLAGAIVAAVVGLFYVTVRLSFVFPAVAVDEGYRLAHAWTHTRRQGFRLLWTMVLISLPLAGVMWIASATFGAYLIPETAAPAGADGAPSAQALRDVLAQNSVAVLIALFGFAAIGYTGMALLVSGISIAFRTATGWVPAAGGPPAPAGEDSEDQT